MLEQIGEVALRLDLLASCKIHPVIHISQLKKSVGQSPNSPTLPTTLTHDLELLMEPEELLDVRTRTRGQNIQK